MPNTNCLEGMQCPRCKSEGPFQIECHTMARVFDDGVEEHGDVEWNDDSYCVCHECGHDGAVHNFKLKG